MNKEKYNQIIDDAYKNYEKICMEEVNSHGVSPPMFLYPMWEKDFINKIKTDKDFSERWGLKIEERELSRDERIDLYSKEYTLGIRNKYEPPFDDFIDAKLKTMNIPTKLITITYNNETIESYKD